MAIARPGLDYSFYLCRGYSGYEGMYVLEGSLQTALNQSGVGLDFYRFYNVDFFTPAHSGVNINSYSILLAHEVMSCPADSPKKAFHMEYRR